jgi:hypothetical protein
MAFDIPERFLGWIHGVSLASGRGFGLSLEAPAS